MSPALPLKVHGKKREFDIDDPELPKWIKKRALTDGGYPYQKRLDREVYEKDLAALHVELVKLQYWQKKTGARIVAVFEGRDAAGKGGSIKALRSHINPRLARVVALPKPSDRERSQWYFQRYVAHLPAASEMVLFDRSWYNRAGVEPVMGFCSPKEHHAFLREAPAFEAALTRAGIHLVKYWLAIGRTTQLKRFHQRRHDPRKIWKLSPMDIAAIEKWNDYTAARDLMLRSTHTEKAPWTVVRMNDKRRGRLALMRHFLSTIDYDDKDKAVVGSPDPLLVQGGEKPYADDARH